MDVNEAALEASDPAEKLEEIIRKAAWLGKGPSPSVPVSMPVVDVPPAAVPVESELKDGVDDDKRESPDEEADTLDEDDEPAQDVEGENNGDGKLRMSSVLDNQRMLAQVIDYYQRTLKENTDGLRYLRKRGITHGAIIDHFRIGYSNRTLGAKLPCQTAKEGKRIRWKLERMGLYRGTGREYFHGCVTFPIMAADGSGRIVDIYGHRIQRPSNGAPSHLHLSRQPRGCGTWRHCGQDMKSSSAPRFSMR